jgi:hypothetical protein
MALNNRSSAGRRIFAACLLTARQYGEVVLPDAAPLQSCPGRLQSGPGAKRVWRVFLPSWYKVLSKLGVSRYNFERSREPITGTGFLLRALAQCRGTMLIEAGKQSRYIGFILLVMARVRVQTSAGSVLGAGFCKNRDKQLTHSTYDKSIVSGTIQ